MPTLSHSRGHSTRLDRKVDTTPKPFGSPDYGKQDCERLWTYSNMN